MDGDELSLPPPPSGTATWSFVQMNMSLLPIARPLPVATAVCTRRLHESKPCTPTPKLHRRVLHSGANISPRRHDAAAANNNNSSSVGVRRLSNTALLDAAAATTPTHSQRFHSASSLPPALARCRSEELAPSSALGKRDAAGGGCASDSSDGGAAPRAYKGKRILELLDEERRLCPDERSAQSPAKRSRLQH
ncbi:hypothetical protein PybrP1_001376 [[Pythium] brassicae (nom. inval.)]|nr:hypothetical protein PybrP1_001376 [[Pythium] brassicae (nom. inval.)]